MSKSSSLAKLIINTWKDYNLEIQDGCGETQAKTFQSLWKNNPAQVLTVMEIDSCFLADVQRQAEIIPSVALPSGLLMSSSFLWLSQRMELYEPSATLGNNISLARVAIPKNIPEAMLGIPNGILFAFFLAGTAGLTGATIASVTHRHASAKIFALQLVLALAGLIASGMVGFSLEEIVLVCLPNIIGCSILSSSVAGRKQAAYVHQEKFILSGV